MTADPDALRAVRELAPELVTEGAGAVALSGSWARGDAPAFAGQAARGGVYNDRVAVTRG
jgi:hypothetical protein